MQRYFFHVHDGQNIPDDVGEVLESRDAAQIEAIQLSGRLISDHAKSFRLGEIWTMEVKDENALILFRLTFFIDAPPVVADAKHGQGR